MELQITTLAGRAYALVPLDEYKRMKEQLEDYAGLMEIRKGKPDHKDVNGHPYEIIEKEVGLHS